MTNSTNTPTEDSKSTPKKKKVKKKGPIRFEAIIPVSILFVLIGVYFSIFFDANLKSGAEFAGTYIHGAEVNIGSIRTSVFNGSFTLNGLQVTDKKQPERNLVQIGKIHFQFLWDALLRAKFVVNDATIENIQAYVPRQKPGRILPVSESKGKNKALKKIKEGAVDQAKEEFNDNLLGDVAGVLGGNNVDDQLKNIQGDLLADKEIKRLQTELKEKEKQWKARIDGLPQKEQIDGLVAKAKALKFNTNDPVQFSQDLKSLDKLFKEADREVKNFKSASKELKGDLKTFNNAFADLDKLAKKDLNDLQSRLKIPNIDVGNFSKNLFGKIFQQRVAQIKKYMDLGREYMPPKKSKEETTSEMIPRKRSEGKDFRFPVTTGYPLFWLQYAKISSEPSESEYSGRLQGEIKDLTSHPVDLGKPTLITLQGDFPKQKIIGLDTLLTIDHTTDEPYEKLELKVAEYPLGSQSLSNSSDVKLAVQKAIGNIAIIATLKNQEVHVALDNKFQNIDYEIEAKSKTFENILTNIVNDIPVVTLKALAHGSWGRLKFNISSNLGQELANGFKKQVDQQIAEMKAKLKKFIDERISGERKKLEAKVKESTGKITGILNDKQKELDQAKGKVQSEIKQQKKKAKAGGTKKLEKAGKKLLKSFGF